jgi:hypothetical protein
MTSEHRPDQGNRISTLLAKIGGLEPVFVFDLATQCFEEFIEFGFCYV